MARIRTIKPELHSSRSLARCSIPARWAFVGLLTLCDDEGRMIDLPKRFAGELFPHEEEVSPAMVIAWIDELEQVDCVRRYEIDDQKYMYLPQWKKHQVISKPTKSRIPDPPEVSQGNPGEPRNVLDFVRNPADSQREVEVEVEVEKEMEVHSQTQMVTRAKNSDDEFFEMHLGGSHHSSWLSAPCLCRL